jgi:hypothetical protein
MLATTPKRNRASKSSDAKMTPDQITEAQRMARVPLPKMRP